MVTSFPLHLPERTSKPRSVGLTHVLDKGMPESLAADVLATCAPYIDVWKFGWGTAYIDPHLEGKLACLKSHGILGCVGGTLLEVAWTQRRVDEFHDWAAQVGFPCVEVSRGVAPMSPDEKWELISRFARDFTVLSEVGSKSRANPLPCAEWAGEVAGDIQAGARWVVAEGRESGTVGIYHDQGAVREDVISCVVAAGGIDRVMFEAPAKDQQVWFIQRFGPDVNLGNIAINEVMGLETLRLGLRADTIALSSPATVEATR